MAKHIIINGNVVEQNLTHINSGDATPPTPFTVPFNLWQDNAHELNNNDAFAGVRVSGSDDIFAIGETLAQHKLVAIEFDNFVDGRGYSIARLLRTRFGFTGELRAMGNVLKDQLYYMQQCGFNAFEVEEEKDINTALNGLKDFSVTYQTY